jgi:TupA-like ATPgrasp
MDTAMDVDRRRVFSGGHLTSISLKASTKSVIKKGIGLLPSRVGDSIRNHVRYVRTWFSFAFWRRHGYSQIATWEPVLRHLPLAVAVRLEFLLCHHRFGRLKRPRTFNEKIMHRRLYDRDPRLPSLSDKVQVKEYATRVLGEGWVIPNIWVGEKLPPRSQRNWPIPYVLKASHGSGWNIFVCCPQDQDWDHVDAVAEQWLRRDYGWETREWAYTQIKPRRLLVEAFMGTRGVAPPDYKLFVFDGRTALVQVDVGRQQTHRQFFYDTNWKRKTFCYVCPLSPEEVEPPQSLAKMVWAAERLAVNFPFVRVDFYEIAGKPYLGELTFYPNAGQIAFKPESVDQELGGLWPD